ncbi:Crp/Fnr family transcriptional regulator [Flavitalea sp. BT771]|uniref:Crp/Fnr family transcriptional regulator n=1 Tax=Flavitalea sp. BT771 TaxID=3063329 RepID=UPI0026E1B6D9|nr:Crp/Fnr family transcriptional regulator [Flavitalea sp. BT771]MDO6434463.1 Crp/Fnr family transcriptional regulator [Flavitalea sp. BT771]MDV6223363.1 Crp/Fnr family transcriptional regulator [Flavitalea sp. BT771]
MRIELPPEEHSVFSKKWNQEWGRSPMAFFVNHIHPVRSVLLDYIDEHCFTYTIRKGKLLLKAGEFCHHLYFVRRGVLRAYIQEDAKEITTWITAEEEMVTSIRSLFDPGQPSLENIQAIEDCELVGAQYASLQYAYDHFIEMNIVGRKLLERYYCDAEERAYISRLNRAESKYRHFIHTKGRLVNRIPLKYIASYLGMTLETLSRIRSKIR